METGIVGHFGEIEALGASGRLSGGWVEVTRKMTMDNEMLERWEQMRDAILEFGQALMERVGRVLEAMKPAMEALLEACWDAYRAAGMPYGESDDGMMRWLREMGEINRLRMEARRLEAHHRGMAAFRRMVEEKGIANRE